MGCAWECCPQRRCWVVTQDFGETITGTGPYRRACEWVGGLVLAPPTIGSCQDQSAQRSIRASEELESSSTGGPATVPSCGSKSKAKSKSIPNGPNAQAPVPATTQVNGAALAKSAASAAIVEAVHGHSHGNRSLGTTDRNQCVREVLTLIHVRRLSSYTWPFVYVVSFPPSRFFLSSSS